MNNIQESSNKETFQDNFCPICYENISPCEGGYQKANMKTKCGHSFCLDCYQECARIKSDCPICRRIMNNNVLLDENIDTNISDIEVDEDYDTDNDDEDSDTENDDEDPNMDNYDEDPNIDNDNEVFENVTTDLSTISKEWLSKEEIINFISLDSEKFGEWKEDKWNYTLSRPGWVAIIDRKECVMKKYILSLEYENNNKYCKGCKLRMDDSQLIEHLKDGGCGTIMFKDEDINKAENISTSILDCYECCKSIFRDKFPFTCNFCGVSNLADINAPLGYNFVRLCGKDDEMLTKERMMALVAYDMERFGCWDEIKWSNFVENPEWSVKIDNKNYVKRKYLFLLEEENEKFKSNMIKVLKTILKIIEKTIIEDLGYEPYDRDDYYYEMTLIEEIVYKTDSEIECLLSYNIINLEEFVNACKELKKYWFEYNYKERYTSLNTLDPDFELMDSRVKKPYYCCMTCPLVNSFQPFVEKSHKGHKRNCRLFSNREFEMIKNVRVQYDDIPPLYIYKQKKVIYYDE